MLTSAKLNATTMRWVGELANYNFKIKYRPGKQSIDCDFLSRYPCECSENLEELKSEEIGAIVAGCKEKGKFARVGSIAAAEIVNVRESMNRIPTAELREAQEEDGTIRKVLQVVRGGEMPNKAENDGK